MKRRLAMVLCALAPFAWGGCLTVGDDEGAILRIELYWDERVGSSNFEGGTCHSAGVEDIDWALLDQDGEEVAGDGGSCANRIDVLGSVPGEYVLEITGHDESGDPKWHVRCSELLVLRFDVAYRCDVDAN